MKNFYLLLILCCAFSSCTNDNNDAAMMTPSTTQLASKPEANSMFDNSYKGIYKGIVIGNVSGTLYVDILNDSKIWAKLVTSNHETFTLADVTPVEAEGKSSVPYFRNYVFARENVSFEIRISDNGETIIPYNFKYFSDTSSKIFLVKEKSTSLIKCYTGTYISDEETGVLNFISDGHLKVKGLSKNSAASIFETVNGELTLMSPSGDMSKINSDLIPRYQLDANLYLGHIRGFFDGSGFNGNWTYDGGEIGNWNATRIL